MSQIIDQLKIFKKLFIHKKRYFLKNQSILRESCNQNKSLIFGIYLTFKFLITELQLIGPKNKTAKQRNYYIKTSSDLKIENRFDEKYRFIFMDVFVVLWSYLLTTELSCLKKNIFGHTNLLIPKYFWKSNYLLVII